MLATPVRVDDKLIIAYQTQHIGSQVRNSHRVAVIDLENRTFDDAFPEIELKAQKPAVNGSMMVKFNASTALSRATLAHGRSDVNSLGYVYVSFGNRADVQPWHGWVFEINLGRRSRKSHFGRSIDYT